jgi:hypothetical protein
MNVIRSHAPKIMAPSANSGPSGSPISTATGTASIAKYDSRLTRSHNVTSRSFFIATVYALVVAAIPARGDFAFPSVRVDWGTTPPTSCRPVEIFVDTDADTDGAVCICKAVDTWKCGTAGTVAHASTHENGGADEISVTGLSGALADPQKAGSLDDANDTEIDTTDTPGDGDILKYDLASDKARWAAASAGSFTNLDTDYGDETVTSSWNLGGALLELPNSTAPTGTDCDDAAEAGRVHVDTNATTGQQVYVCEGAAGWVQQGGDPTASAPYGDYDPDNPPGSGLDAACSDEFAGGSSTGTWRWGNQGSAALTLGAGAALLTGDGNTSQRRTRWCTPSAGSWVYTASMSHTYTDTSTTRERCGISVLLTGSEATPTLVHSVSSDFPTTSTASATWGSDNDYDEAAGGALVATLAPAGAFTQAAAGAGVCFQARYDAAADTLRGCYAPDCLNWRCGTAAGSITTDPVSVGFFVIEHSVCAVSWTRLCTSGACMSAPFPAGE